MRVCEYMRESACVCAGQTDKQSNGREEERGRSGVTEGDRNGRGRGEKDSCIIYNYEHFFNPPFFIAFFS